MVNIYAVQLQDLLPESLKQDLDTAAIAEAITQELQSISSETIRCVLLSRIDEFSEQVLDLLAWHFHVDFYDTSLEVAQKRELVKNSLPWHKRKGTPAAVEELITAVFGDGRVEEWFEYEGQPYYFRVLTNNSAVTNEQAAEFTRALESVKNARSWLEAIIFVIGDEMELYLGGALHMGEYMTVKQVV